MQQLIEIAQRAGLPEREAYTALIKQTIEVLQNEDPLYRPRDERNRPGGMLRLNHQPTIIIPDLHARPWFVLQVLAYRPGGQPDSSTVFELLSQGELQMVCVGDGFHGESRAAQRWKKAFKEFTGKYHRHSAMDEEMRESLSLMEIVMQLKSMRPDSFHFLKGNHENILNEEGRGNHPFRKFAFEGEMVKEWVLKFYGEEFIYAFAEMEHEFPLLAVDGTFMVSHAEPQRYFTHEEVIRYREYDDVVLGLTWTPNDGAEEGSVNRMIADYCSHPDQARYFGGHRPVQGKFNLRAEDKYVQLHNPGTYSFALLQPGIPPDPQQDILVLPHDEEAVLRAEE
ncbi:MAG: metallophosphoesterase [Spirochaetaceae bacterium]|nr:metallophosphoesterase [Spirochaetaceae bacterium]MCF7947957.1 metallophosphoesterase [Spirochaetia bacterium]MCF7951258.1 metallophosphoesterase [Spirochaetaceae bacterium]